MQQRQTIRITATTVAAAIAFSGVLAGIGTIVQSAAAETVASSHTRSDTHAVKRWIERNAHRIESVDPSAPLDDLAAASLRRSVGNAPIVGLGEPAHKVKEMTTLKHRTLRYLVERMGFRTIAWEDDWTLGMQVDTYIRTGKGDPEELLEQMDAWDTRECADVLRWLRAFNTGRPESDKVRFFGVEHWHTWRPAYSIVQAYVREAAPGLVPELKAHLEPIRPKSETMQKHVEWYKAYDRKEVLVDHAQRMYDLIEGRPHRPGDRAYSLAEHAARQIRSFYLTYYLPYQEAVVHRDARAAENLRWRHGYDGRKIVYWAASPHTAVAPDQQVVQPPDPGWGFPSAGSYLRRWFGTGYRSIGFTFDHGHLQGAQIPPPDEDWFEHPFGQVTRHDQMLLDLRRPTPAPEPVTRWLQAPVKTRGLLESPGSYITGGTLSRWFDVIVHRQAVTQARPLPGAPFR